MKSHNSMLMVGTALVAAGLLVAAGCGSKQPEAPRSQAAAESHDANEHGHAKGIIALGDYHARIAIEQGGVLKLFILGKDESKVDRIEDQQIEGILQSAEGAEGTRVTLKSDRQPGDPEGQTSQFVGMVPEALRGKPLTADLKIVIRGEAYRPKFESVPGTGHAGGHGMPKGVSADKERELFLTPGGLYTAADIAANGNLTPGQKFKDIQFHAFEQEEPDLKPGDKVCPVTNNRSDPKCAWVVNGKKYEFCCPPCLNKFVGWAKNQPGKIKEPGAYIYKE